MDAQNTLSERERCDAAFGRIMESENAPCTGSLLAWLIWQAAKADAAGHRPSDDDMWDQTLRERDRNHDWADKLAAEVARLKGVDIGEHSSDNNPWLEALDAPDAAGQQELVAEVRRNAAGQVYITDGQGQPFNVSKHVGAKLYAAPVMLNSLTRAETEATASVAGLQGGLSNDELRAALATKLQPGAEYTDAHLTGFALGVEWAAAMRL